MHRSFLRQLDHMHSYIFILSATSHFHSSNGPNFLFQAEMVHEDIESALADHKFGKKIRPQTLK